MKLEIYRNNELINEMESDIYSFIEILFTTMHKKTVKLKIKGNPYNETQDFEFTFKNEKGLKYVYKDIPMNHGYINQYKLREIKA